MRPGLESNPIAAYGYEDARVLPVVGVSAGFLRTIIVLIFRLYLSAGTGLQGV